MNFLRIITGVVTVLLALASAGRLEAFDSVVIDPGHGGNDEGTAWYHVKEKDTTLAVALRLEMLLQKNNIPCVLTRRTDVYVSLDDRVKIANEHPGSLMVSIHFNGSPVTNEIGFSTYYFPESPSGKFVARKIQEAMDESQDSRNRGVLPETYAVLVRTMGCAVLVECGFLSNKAEGARLASAEGQQWLAQSLLLGIMRAMPVKIEDPPETEMAKCAAYERRIERKGHRRP